MAMHDLFPTAAPVAHAADRNVDGVASGKPVAGALSTTSNAATIAGYQMQSKPIIALVLVMGLLFAMRLLKDAVHLASEHDHTPFRQVDISLWNALIISLIAIPGIAIWKFLTTEYLHPANPFRTLVAAV